jgi:cytoskeleton protein RodZ
MPLFSQSLKPESEDDMPTTDTAGSDQAPRRTIGELLRETRLSYGGQINQIATTLRIRAAYLTAIEESHYDRLPAQVYALGFVRAYATHLGLDADEAVRRFKQETAAFELPRGLSFPVPLAERSVPGGTMLLAALILAFCGYGLWYYVSTGERARPERVSVVPAELKPVPPPSQVMTPPPVSPPPEAAAPVVSATPPSVAEPAPQAAAPTLAPLTPTPSPSLPSISTPPTPASPPYTPPPPGVTILSSPPPTPAPAAASDAASTPPVTPAVGAAPNPPAASAVAPKPAAAPPNTPRPPDQARVFGAIDAPSRIIIEVRKDSWVQIREGNRILVDRVLHPGESYRVPDRPGLILRTGNGSGLDIAVDGAKAPSVGGTVRHNIALDPGRLMAGTAISD